MHLEDGILVRRTLCGDKSAFALLVERYQGVVYRIAHREVGNHHDAEDIAQESFLKAYRKLKNLKDPNVFPSWLYAITVNLCNSWWRKQKRQMETTELSKAPRGEFQVQSNVVGFDLMNSVRECPVGLDLDLEPDLVQFGHKVCQIVLKEGFAAGDTDPAKD